MSLEQNQELIDRVYIDVPEAKGRFQTPYHYAYWYFQLDQLPEALQQAQFSLTQMLKQDQLWTPEAFSSSTGREGGPGDRIVGFAFHSPIPPMIREGFRFSVLDLSTPKLDMLSAFSKDALHAPFSKPRKTRYGQEWTLALNESLAVEPFQPWRDHQLSTLDYYISEIQARTFSLGKFRDGEFISYITDPHRVVIEVSLDRISRRYRIDPDELKATLVRGKNSLVDQRRKINSRLPALTNKGIAEQIQVAQEQYEQYHNLPRIGLVESSLGKGG